MTSVNVKVLPPSKINGVLPDRTGNVVTNKLVTPAEYDAIVANPTAPDGIIPPAVLTITDEAGRSANLAVKEDGTVSIIESIGGGGGGGTSNYDALANKPKINGVTLSGDLTTEDLNIEAVGSYNDLDDRPMINGHVLTGDQTAEDLGITGGSGTTDYEDLTNKPTLNGVELTGDLSSKDAGIITVVTDKPTDLSPYQDGQLITVLNDGTGSGLPVAPSEVVGVYDPIPNLALQSSTLRYIVNAGYLTARFASEQSVTANRYDNVAQTITNIADLQPFQYGVTKFVMTNVPNDISAPVPYEIQFVDYTQIHRMIFDFNTNTILMRTWNINDLQSDPEEQFIYNRTTGINIPFIFTSPAYITYIDPNIYPLLSTVEFAIEVVASKRITPPEVFNETFSFNADNTGTYTVTYQNTAPLYFAKGSDITTAAPILSPLSATTIVNGNLYSSIPITATDQVIYIGLGANDAQFGSLIRIIDLQKARNSSSTGLQSIASTTLTVSTAGNDVTINLPTSVTEALTKANTAVQAETDPTVDPKIANHNTATGVHTNEFANYVPKSGTVMTGGLTLNAAPTSDLMAATKKYVDDQISGAQSGAFTFIGFISTVQPTGDVREGNLWYQPASAESTPDETFPWTVKTYTAGSWGATTTTYTPTAFDLWSNIDDEHGYYYFGSNWNGIDFAGSTFNPDLFEVVNGVVTLKTNSITNEYISTNAALDLSKVNGLQDALDTKLNKPSGTVAGNVPVFDANGQIIDSGEQPGSGGGIANITSTTLNVTPGTDSTSIELTSDQQDALEAAQNALTTDDLVTNITTTVQGRPLDASQAAVLAAQINGQVNINRGSDYFASLNLYLYNPTDTISTTLPLGSLIGVFE